MRTRTLIVIAAAVALLAAGCGGGGAGRSLGPVLTPDDYISQPNTQATGREITIHVVVESTKGFSKLVNPTFAFKQTWTPITMVPGFCHRIKADAGNDHRSTFDVKIPEPAVLYAGMAHYQPVVFEDKNANGAWEIWGQWENGYTARSARGGEYTFTYDPDDSKYPSRWSVRAVGYDEKAVNADGFTLVCNCGGMSM